MSKPHVALVVGASGVIGDGLTRRLATTEGWKVTGMSRRGAPAHLQDLPWIAADLENPNWADSQPGLGAVTHVFHAGYIPRPDLADEAEVNGRILRNLLDSLARAGAPIQRIVLYQGGKVYGLHLGPVKTPMRESDPRHMPPNFYYDQEDILIDFKSRLNWDFTLLRPDIVTGALPGQPLNLAMVIGSWAAFCKEYGLPFRFPGTALAASKLAQLTDNDLLARVSLWAALEPRAAGEAYNVSNGDLIRWENLWPWLGQQLGLASGPAMGIRLVNHMRDKGALWAEMAARHGLVEADYQKAVGWGFGDFIFHTEHDVLFDLNKLRAHGCSEVLNSDTALLENLRDLERRRIIPPIFPDKAGNGA